MTLKPLQTYITMIVPNKHSSQARTLKLHVSLCHNQHRGTMITLQHLRLTILLSKIFRETNLVILEEANTTYGLDLIIITQNYTDIDVRKILFHPVSCAIFTLFFYFAFFRTHHSNFLFSRRHIQTHIHQLKLTEMQHST